MTRRQVAAIVRVEAVLTAAIGALIGSVLGILLAAAVVRALSGAASISLIVPGRQLLTYLAVATLGGVLAGALPARRAARTDVLAAVAVR